MLNNDIEMHMYMIVVSTPVHIRLQVVYLLVGWVDLFAKLLRKGLFTVFYVVGNTSLWIKMEIWGVDLSVTWVLVIGIVTAAAWWVGTAN